MTSIKAVAVLSGGLDSMIAAKLIMEQGIAVYGFTVATPFFGPQDGYSKHSKVELVATKLGIPLHVDYVGQEYIELIKKPRWGYGNAFNPCIDCHKFFFERAKAYMDSIGANFLISGEVQGQRPMSQTRQSIDLIERKANIEGLLVRPLSAKHFPPSIPEQNGWIKRELLGDLQGRQRKWQIELATKWGFDQFTSSGGGCVLTEKGYAKKLIDLIKHKEDTPENIRYLRIGRHFRLPDGSKIVLGKNKQDNETLLTMMSNGGYFLDITDGSNPITVLVNYPLGDADLILGAQIMLRYTKYTDLPSVQVNLHQMPDEVTIRSFDVTPIAEEEVKKYIIAL